MLNYLLGNLLVAKKNHSDHDCVLVVVSSHGYEGDRIMASDKLNYHSSELWAPFTSDKCRSLASKPKLFFIQVELFLEWFLIQTWWGCSTQACRGVNTDKGNPVRASSLTSKDALVAEFSIPTQADFLFVYSTVPGKPLHFFLHSFQAKRYIFIRLQVMCRTATS